jgi:hypothetical protein
MGRYSGDDMRDMGNFWKDESHQILSVAYYNGGVVAIDVSGDALGQHLHPHDRHAQRPAIGEWTAKIHRTASPEGEGGQPGGVDALRAVV